MKNEKIDIVRYSQDPVEYIVNALSPARVVSVDILANDDSNSVFDDEEMINTAEEFLENSLNVSETARNLFMHRNTLIYRLDKIEKETGLNIRNFSDAVTFRLITILHKVIG